MSRIDASSADEVVEASFPASEDMMQTTAALSHQDLPTSSSESPRMARDGHLEDFFAVRSRARRRLRA